MNGTPYTLHLGDCRAVLATLADSSVDSIVTDPPYELGFMGKGWDASGIANDATMWAECLRVLKPGGHLLAFSGSRTYHRMVCAIEDGGFEVRDQIMWLYGSGFPKSHNLSGDWHGWGTALKPAHEPICVARKPFKGTVAGNVLEHGTGALNIAACRVGDEVRHESFTSFAACHGNALGKPGTAEARRGTQGEPKEYVGRWPANVIHDGSPEVLSAFAQFGEKTSGSRKAGTYTIAAGSGRFGEFGEFGEGAMPAVDGSTGTAARFFFNAGQVGQSDLCNANAAESNSNLLSQVDGFAQNLAAIAAHHADKPLSDLIQRFMSDMASALRQIDETDTQMIPSIERRFLRELQPISTQATTENRASPAEVLALTSTTMIIQSLSSIAGSVDAATSNIIGTILAHGVRACARELRNRFMYCAKASRADRNHGLEDPGPQFKKGTTLREVEVMAAAGEIKGNTHPTVKPTDLMAYLCRLVTPSGGVVLDPFMGSGSTGKAAMREGFRFIGIDMTPEYVEIARARIDASWRAAEAVRKVCEPSPQIDLFEVVT